MFAAKAGHSTLGIPQKVGAEFANADPGGHLPMSAPGPRGPAIPQGGAPTGGPPAMHPGGMMGGMDNDADDQEALMNPNHPNHGAALMRAVHAHMKRKLGVRM